MSQGVSRTGLKDSPPPTSGKAARAPRSAARLGVAAQMAVATLKANTARFNDPEFPDDLAQRVSDARRCGLSWELIGWSLGMPAEAARHRWGLGVDSLLSAQ